MNISYEKALEDMVSTARAAGELTQAHFSRFRDIEIGIKGPGDFVSDADREAELLIRDRLISCYPQWGLTGEEFPPALGHDASHRWLVDPIDGTTNFLNGLHYTITIALRRGSETICGVVYNPVADEMFTAMRHAGAYLNGRRMAVSTTADIALLTVGTGLPTPNLSLYPGAYARLDAIRAPIGAVRILGSAANSCAHVACGRLSGYYEETGFIDTAAGLLMVEEAGGMVTDWWGRGSEFYEGNGCLIAANPAAHAYLLERLRQAPRKEMPRPDPSSP